MATKKATEAKTESKKAVESAAADVKAEAAVEKKAAAKPAAKKPAAAKPAAKKPASKKAAELIIQSALGGEITPEAILAKIGAADKIYVRVDQNKAYWVRGEETGSVELW